MFSRLLLFYLQLLVRSPCYGWNKNFRYKNSYKSFQGDVLVEQYKYQINDEDESADLPVLPTGIYVVYWLRFSLLLIAWTVFAFTEPPGGALYARIKEQNRISN